MMLEDAKVDPASVRIRLVRFGNDSLELDVFAYVPTSDEAVFLGIQEELLLRIMDIVEASGAAFSLPTEAPSAPTSFAVNTRNRDAPEK